MPLLRVAFLIAVLTVSSGFTFRCIFLCGDTTAIQGDYTIQRDRCREYAQMKLDTETSDANDEKSHKGQLVTLFSECMAKHGWTVPDGREGLPPGEALAPVAPSTPMGQATTAARPAQPAAGTLVPLIAAPVPVVPMSHTAFLQRSSECAFARQAASASTIAANRAKACDLECADRLRAAPDMPRPAACPPDPNAHPDYNKGND